MSKRTGGFIGQDGINAPDQATEVSAESLGISSQVNVSFTAPSDVGGAAVTGYSVQSNNGDGTYESSFDIADASYDSLSFSVASQDANPLGLVFNNDGTKLYVVGSTSDTVYQYSLSTAFDISTTSYDSVSFSVNSQEATPTDIAFNNDGTKLYIVGASSRSVHQYSLSSAFDLSTASYDSVSFSFNSQDTSSYGIAFNNAGTKIYMVGNTTDSLYQYSLSTAFDISTTSYDSVSFSVAGQDSTPRGVAFNTDGTKMILVGITGDNVYQYSLSSALDLSTASYDSVSFSVAQDTAPSDIAFNSDGTKMYILGATNDTVYQYSTGQLGYPTSSPVTVTGLTNGTSYTFNVWAINAFGWSSPSDASGSASPFLLIPRALFSGSSTGPSNSIGYVAIATTGNTADFGDLVQATYYQSGCASSTRGIFSGGASDSTRIEYVTIMSTGNSTDFGDLLYGGNAGASCSNSTRGVIALNNQMQYITIATTANALDFGDRTVNVYASAGCASPTRGLFAGGESSTNVIDYITIASTGNAIDFGNLTQSRSQLGSVSSDVRGVWGGGASGPNAVNRIDYVTISSTGNAIDFGDLTVSRYGLAAAGSNTRGIFGAGVSSGRNLDYVTISSTGNAIDFGDNNTPAASHNREAACSNAHGGLS